MEKTVDGQDRSTKLQVCQAINQVQELISQTTGLTPGHDELAKAMKKFCTKRNP